MAKITSSVELVDMDRCLDAFGGDRNDLIYAATTRSREIAYARAIATRLDGTIKYEHTPPVEALLEVMSGKIGIVYLHSVNKANALKRKHK